MFVFTRKVRRVSAWTDQWSDGALALSEIYDHWVEKAGRLTVWKCADSVDEDAIVAIAAEIVGACETQTHFRVDAAWLDDRGLSPVHSPDRAASSHRRARDLHHDLVGLDESACRKLCLALWENYSTIHVRFPKKEVKARVRRELAQFDNDEVRDRLADEVGPMPEQT